MEAITTISFVNFYGMFINNHHKLEAIKIYDRNGEILLTKHISYYDFYKIVFPFETKLKRKKDLSKNIPFIFKENKEEDYTFYLPSELVDFKYEGEVQREENNQYVITCQNYSIAIKNGEGMRVSTVTNRLNLYKEHYEYTDEWKRIIDLSNEIQTKTGETITPYALSKLLKEYNITSK